MNIIQIAFLSFTLFNFVQLAVEGNSDPNDSPINQHDDSYSNDAPGEPLSPFEFEKAANLVLPLSVPDNSSTDPIEKAGLFEGDIVLDSEDGKSYNGEKNAIANPNNKWPNGIVPYAISSSFNNDERITIARAMMEFESQTCIRFRPWRVNDDDYIWITTGDGCSSPVGRVGGQQDVTLGNGCVYLGIVMHELNHVVGFWHEQSRQDRDDHITVHFENIQQGAEANFRKVSWSEAQSLGARYDVESIMHYGPYAFTRNRRMNKRTITPKVTNDRMGQRENFTKIDVYKINRLYDCDRKPKNNTASQNPTTTQRSTPENSAGANCVDGHKNCESWANSGECQNNPNWMLANCKKSCNQCRAPCSNKNKPCDYWAENGECSKNPDYMNENCAKACKRC